MNDLGFRGKRVVAIIPHQDDEVIGMGGQLATAASEAAELHLVLVTDGAACGGVNCLTGAWPCVRLSELGGEGEGLVAHDDALESRDGGEWHGPHTLLPFEILDAPDRAPGKVSPAWGKQRDHEFAAVAEALGVRRDHIWYAYWDPGCPERIKDGQTAVSDHVLTPDSRSARYRRVAEHYFALLRPDLVMTMAPYEFMSPPNDHWAIAMGVAAAAEHMQITDVRYIHSGVLYQHLAKGGDHIGTTVELSQSLWGIKRAALSQYLRWDPAHGWFATAAHSVPETFRALLSGLGQKEYFSREPAVILHKGE